MPKQHFTPEVKTHMITQFLGLQEMVQVSDHRTAFRKAEQMFRTWVGDQHEKERQQWLDGTMYGSCQCGYVYESDTDCTEGHGSECPFTPDDPHIYANGSRSTIVPGG